MLVIPYFLTHPTGVLMWVGDAEPGGGQRLNWGPRAGVPSTGRWDCRQHLAEHGCATRQPGGQAEGGGENNRASHQG